MPLKRGPAPPNPTRPDGNVQVGRGRSNFVYADLTKHLLAGGQKEVEISALGSIISDAVAVVEMLKNQGLVVVSKIETSRGAGTNARSATTDKIAIWVQRAPGFETEYERQMAERKAKLAKEAEEKASEKKE
jgi:DNA-binding protein